VTTVVTLGRRKDTGHNRQGASPGTGDGGKGHAAGGTSLDDEVERHASTGGKGASSEISRFCRLLGDGGARRGRVRSTNLIHRQQIIQSWT